MGLQPLVYAQVARVVAEPGYGGAPVTVPQLVRWAQFQQLRPAHRQFGILRLRSQVDVAEGFGARVGANAPNVEGVRIVHMVSCAAVCFVHEENGYLYHARSGIVPKLQVDAALEAIGATEARREVYVAYAHNKISQDRETNQDYQTDLMELYQRDGLLRGRIVEVCLHMPGENCAMDAELRFGF